MFLKNKYFVRTFRKLLRMYSHLRSKWRLFVAQTNAMINNGRLIYEPGLKLNCPLRCDGAGTVKIHHDVILGYAKAPRYASGEMLIQARNKKATIDVGAGTATSNNVALIANEKIHIGKNCIIGELVSIFDSDFHDVDADKRGSSNGKVAPVFIGDNVWLGSRIMVMKGVTIGSNSVIAAGSVVTNSIPENVLAGGVPAKIIRKLK